MLFYYLFFAYFHLIFLMSIFEIRGYNDLYLSCSCVPHPMEFTAFIDESVEKNKTIFGTNGGFKILP